VDSKDIIDRALILAGTWTTILDKYFYTDNARTLMKWRGIREISTALPQGVRTLRYVHDEVCSPGVEGSPGPPATDELGAHASLFLSTMVAICKVMA